ncbi:MAG: S8 family serine peptidase [Nitrospirota bacterium]
MRYIFLLIVLLALVSCGESSRHRGGDPAALQSSAIDRAGLEKVKNRASRYVPGEILVKFKAKTPAYEMMALHREIGVSRVTELDRVGVQRILLSGSSSVDEAIRYYRSDPNVEYAEPNYIVRKAVIPNDPGFGEIWGLSNTGQTGGLSDADIDGPEAWDLTTGTPSIIIAVVDSGVAYGHPDLAQNIWRSAVEIEGNGLDDDHNGYADDIYGWDFIDGDGYPEDLDSHGTHVAGIIASRGNNGIGGTGVMWSAAIMSVRFLGVSGVGNVADAAEAIIYAADNGARIINASWGGYDYSNTLYNAIDYARSKGVMLVAAAGNDAVNSDITPFYPAGFNLANIISVAASDSIDNLAYFSNYGPGSVDLAAPGVEIYSTLPVLSFGTPVTVYSENFDGASGDLPLLGWRKGGVNATWAITAGTGVNGTNSLEDSPGGNYSADTDSWAGYLTPISSAKNNRYALSFLWRGHIDPLTFDFLQVMYSVDGTNWTAVAWTDGDTDGNFVPFSTSSITEAADLYDGFYIGVGMKTDSTLQGAGAYVDDLHVQQQTVTIGGYTYEFRGWSGTSLAAPYVSGVAGLILSNNPSLSYSDVRNIILNSVDKKVSLLGLTAAGGRVNAFASLHISVPPAPSSLSATAVSATKIDLSWVDPSAFETGFSIERKTGEMGTYAEIAQVVANTSSYHDGGLNPSTTYYYRMRAFNALGFSDYSTEAQATTKQSGSDNEGGGGGGGCSIAKNHTNQTAVADAVSFLLPLFVLYVLRKRYSGAKQK